MVECPMPKFKKGDKVVVISEYPDTYWSDIFPLGKIFTIKAPTGISFYYLEENGEAIIRETDIDHATKLQKALK